MRIMKINRNKETLVAAHKGIIAFGKRITAAKKEKKRKRQ